MTDPVSLQYSRGPTQCLPEEEFRSEVAIAGDGVDRFDPAGPAVVHVWFEKTAGGLYRGSVQYTNAKGERQAPKVSEHENCEVLARWIGQLAYYYQPQPQSAPKDPPPARPAAPAPKVAAAWPPPPLPPQTFVPVRRHQPSNCDDIRNFIRAMDLTIALHGLVLVTAGYTADAGPGFGIGVEARGEMFSLGIELRGILPGKVYAREQFRPDKYSPEFETDVGQISTLFVPCLRFAKYFAGCGVAQVGMVSIFDSVDSRFRPFFTLGPRFAVEAPLNDRVAVFAFGEALINVYGPAQYYLDTAALDSPGVGWRQPLVSGFFGAGLVVKFQ